MQLFFLITRIHRYYNSLLSSDASDRKEQGPYLANKSDSQEIIAHKIGEGSIVRLHNGGTITFKYFFSKDSQGDNSILGKGGEKQFILHREDQLHNKLGQNLSRVFDTVIKKCQDQYHQPAENQKR